MIFNFRKTFSSCFAAAYLSLPLFLSGSLAAAADVPANLDNGLRQLYAEEQQNQLAPAIRASRGHGLARKAVRDTERRVLVNFYLNGKAPLSEVRDRITAAGGNIIAENNKYKNGVPSAFVPVNKLAELAQSPGVLSISMGRRPIRNTGASTSGGPFLSRTGTLNVEGFDGTGISVGLLSY